MSEQAHWTHHDLSHFRSTTGDDLFDIHHHFARWSEGSMPGGYDLYLKSLRGAPTPRVQLHADGMDLFNLASYNYLGLSNHPSLIQAAHRACRTGPRSSRRRSRRCGALGSAPRARPT